MNDIESADEPRLDRLEEWFNEADTWLDENLSYWVKNGSAINQVQEIVESGVFDYKKGEIIVMVPITLNLTEDLEASLKKVYE